MTHYVGLDVSQKLTAICVVDDTGRRLWRGQCTSDPEQIECTIRRHCEDEPRLDIETGPMTPWLVHELRGYRTSCQALSSLSSHRHPGPRRRPCRPATCRHPMVIAPHGSLRTADRHIAEAERRRAPDRAD